MVTNPVTKKEIFNRASVVDPLALGTILLPSTLKSSQLKLSPGCICWVALATPLLKLKVSAPKVASCQVNCTATRRLPEKENCTVSGVTPSDGVLVGFQLSRRGLLLLLASTSQ